jgi:hypothetical protein
VNKNRLRIPLTRPARELGDAGEPQFGLDYVRIDKAMLYRESGHTLDNAKAGAALAVGVGVRVQRSFALDVDSGTVWIVSNVCL